MNLKNEIRALLSEEALTYQQVAARLNVSCSVVDVVTAYEMFDVYEEDDGTMKLLDVEYGKQTRTRHEVTPEMVAIIEELAGKMAVQEIAKEVQYRLGTWISNFSVRNVIVREGLARHTNKIWTSKMDRFLLNYGRTERGMAQARTDVLNKKFGTQFTRNAVNQRFCSLLKQNEY